MSEPGVWVILAVCQSGVGNGHGVITAALTGSSISLYRTLCLSHPPLTHTHTPHCSCDLFPSEGNARERERERNGSSDGAPHRKQEHGGNETQAEPDRCHTPGLREYRTEVCTWERGWWEEGGGDYLFSVWREAECIRASQRGLCLAHV